MKSYKSFELKNLNQILGGTDGNDGIIIEDGEISLGIIIEDNEI